MKLHDSARRHFERDRLTEDGVLRDFPASTLAAHGLVAEHPDNFLASLVTEHPSILGGVAEAIAGTWADADVEMVLKSLAVEAPRSAALISEELKAV